MSELEQFLTGADVARLLSLSRERVRQLHREANDFPPPLGKVGNYVIWRRADIETWAARTGRTLAD